MPQKKILFIEDDTDQQDLWAQIFASRSYEAHIVGSGESALSAYTQHHSDIGLIISDVDLGDTSAAVLLPQFAAIAPIPPVIILSARSYNSPNLVLIRDFLRQHPFHYFEKGKASLASLLTSIQDLMPATNV